MPASDFLDGGRRAFLLEISGLAVRYYSGAAPPSAAVPNTGGVINYTDVNAIVGVGDFGGKLDLAGGVAQFDPVAVTLASNQRDTADTASDPAVVLGRVGARSAGGTVRLAADILASDLMAGAGTITVDSDPAAAGFPSSGLCHIGPEAFHYTAIAAGPPRFTGVTRAAANSRPLEHIIDPGTGSTPEVTAQAVHWRTRRARLLMAPLYPSSAIGDYIEVQRGFIESTPAIGDDGLSVSLSIAPLTALLDVAPAPNRGYARGLQTGYHYFTEGVGDTWEVIQESPGGICEMVTNATAAASGVINVTSAAPHVARFDPPGLVATHPRNGAMLVEGTAGSIDIQNYGAGAPPVQLIAYSGAAPTAALFGGVRVGSARASEAKRATFGPGTVAWPEHARAQIQAAMSPGTASGFGGAWCDVRLEVNGAGGSALRLLPQDGCEGVGVTVTSFPVEAQGPQHGLVPVNVWPGADPEPMTERRGLCWLGLDAAARFDDNFCQYSQADGGVVGDWANRVSDIPAAGLLAPIRGVADAWYQTGEQYILADGDVPIFGAGTGSTYLEVSYVERTAWNEGERGDPIRVRIVSSAFDATSGGYLLEVAEEDRDRTPSFGQFPELGPDGDVRLTPVVVFESATAADVLLQLLFSGSGRKVNSSSYDIQPFGANLNGDDVDTVSIRAIGAPEGLDGWSFQAPGGVSLRDILDPLLIATQSALTMRLDSSGTLKLSRVRIGPEDPSQAEGAIAAGEWSDAMVPRWATDEDIRNAYTFRTNWDPVADEPAREITMNDQRSIVAYGEAESLELDLRGAWIAGSIGDAINYLRPVYSLLSATFADPRRTFEGEIDSGLGLLAQLGAVYTFSSPHLKGYSDTLGVTAAAGRIIETRVGLWTAGASIKATHYDARSTGWNAALRVTSVAAAVCTVDASHYTEGGGDLSYFAVGDTVRAVPRGNQDAATVHTVSAIGVGSITLNPAPAVLAGPDWGDIEPASYASASAVHQALCVIGDASGRINGGADEGYDWG